MAASMEFWGVQIKGGKAHKVEVEQGSLIHLSQATLGEVKKGVEPVTLSVTVNGQKLNLGVLNTDKSPQLSFDLVFDIDFEVSHNSKNGSVHLLGYKTLEDNGHENCSDCSDEEMDVPVETEKKSTEKGAPVPAKAKLTANGAAAKKEEQSREDSSEDDESEDDEGMVNGTADSDEDDDDDDDSDSEEVSDEEEEPPKLVKSGEKRPGSVSNKTSEAKKTKLITPQKTTERKNFSGGHTATPYPSKKGGKSPPSGNKSFGKGKGKNPSQPRNKGRHGGK